MLGITYCGVVWLALHKWHGRLIIKNNALRKLITAGTLRINLLANMYQRGVVHPGEMTAIEMPAIQADHDAGMDWSWFMLVKFNMLSVIMLLVLTFPVEKYQFAAMMFNGLIRSFSAIMQINTQLLKHQNSYSAFHKLVTTELQYEEPTEPLPMPDTLIIESICIEPPATTIVTETTHHVEDFKQCNADEVPKYLVEHRTPFYITAGDMILLRGASGHGKSTFLAGLTGKLPCVTFGGVAQPSNLKHHYSEFYQTIKEDMPFINMTVSELFRGMPIARIEEAARICCCYELICSLHLHVAITRKLSGGEKSRIALATVIADFICNNRAVLIADELEQGVDPPLAYQIYTNIRTRFTHRQLWFVSHLERADTAFEWSHILYFKNGRIE